MLLQQSKRRDEEDEPKNRPNQSAPMQITNSLRLNKGTSPINGCLSPSSLLASEFYHSVAFSPTSSSLDDFNSRSTHPVFIPNQTTTVPLISHSPTTNLIFNLSQKPNNFDYFNQQQQRHDQQTIVDTSTKTSSANTTTTHVLCR